VYSLSTHMVRRHPLRPAPRHPGAHLTAALLALLAFGAAGCSDAGLTDPEEPVAPVAEPDAPAADLTTDPGSVTATRVPKSFFVNPITGKDTNPGTNLLPFKTLARALASATAKDTMRLASGLYSKATNGERFTNATQQVAVPAGVVILGTSAAHGFTSQLHGVAGETGLQLKGAATVKNLIVTGFSTAIRATQGVQSLSNLNLDHNALGLGLSGLAQATLVGSTVVLRPVSGVVVTGARVREQAQFTMNGGRITGGAQNCEKGVTGVVLSEAARLTLKNVATLENIAGVALLMAGTSKATLTSFAKIDRRFFQLPVACAPQASVATFDSASLTLRHARVLSSGGTNSTGIESASRAPLTLDTAEVTGHTGNGVRGLLDFKLVARGSNFRGNGIGIDGLFAKTASITVTGSTVFNNDLGIRAPFFKLRKSVVSLNRIGILLTSPFTDLGQTFDPGNNTITDNLNTGVAFISSVIDGGVGGIFASGNTWNPSTQSSDVFGHYPGKPLLNGKSPIPSGKNFALPVGNSSFQIQL
jgi:hypothetical protein